MARRRRVRVAPVQIPQFANVDQISGSNFRSYIESTAGSPMEGIARSALQIPGGRMLDDELANIDTQISGIDSSIAGVDARLNDPSRREPMPSPYANRLTSLQSEARQVRDSVTSSIREFLEVRHRDLLAQERRTSGRFMKDSLLNEANQVRTLINNVPSFSGNPLQSDSQAISRFLQNNESNYGLRSASYRPQLSRLDAIFPELDSIGLAEQQFQQTANAGITTTMTDAERAQLQGQRANLQREQANLQGQRPRLNSEAAARLQGAARQFNQEQNAGAVAASTTRQSPQRPLTGRFGIPQTGVGISIGGFR